MGMMPLSDANFDTLDEVTADNIVSGEIVHDPSNHAFYKWSASGPNVIGPFNVELMLKTGLPYTTDSNAYTTRYCWNPIPEEELRHILAAARGLKVVEGERKRPFVLIQDCNQ